MKTLQTMNLEELVREGAEIRASAVQQMRRMAEVYKTLYYLVRRNPADETTVSYMMLSQVGQRFASMVLQGVRRVEPLERKIVGASEERKREVDLEEQRLMGELRKQQKETRKEKKATQIESSLSLSDSDFLFLYGEDFE